MPPHQIFYVTVVVMAVLGALVIFALVLGDVEARTYELGMLRALGIRDGTLGALLALQVRQTTRGGVVRPLRHAPILVRRPLPSLPRVWLSACAAPPFFSAASRPCSVSSLRSTSGTPCRRLRGSSGL